jgi:hypothetical protein
VAAEVHQVCLSQRVGFNSWLQLLVSLSGVTINITYMDKTSPSIRPLEPSPSTASSNSSHESLEKFKFLYKQLVDFYLWNKFLKPLTSPTLLNFPLKTGSSLGTVIALHLAAKMFLRDFSSIWQQHLFYDKKIPTFAIFGQFLFTL